MKKSAVLLGSVVIAALLTGCAEQNIEYKGQLMPVSEAEERMADELEVENPDMDLEIKIYQESDE